MAYDSKPIVLQRCCALLAQVRIDAALDDAELGLAGGTHGDAGDGRSLQLQEAVAGAARPAEGQIERGSRCRL